MTIVSVIITGSADIHSSD